MLSEIHDSQLFSEAAILPNEQVSAEVEKQLRRYITYFDSFVEKARAQHPQASPNDLFSIYASDWFDKLVEPLNDELRKYEIQFESFEPDNMEAYFKPSTSQIVVQLMILASAQVHEEKSVREGAIKRIVATIGHELIHKEQNKRGDGRNLSNRNKKSDNSNHSKYRNTQHEVMAWAFSLIKSYVDNGEITDTNTAVSIVKKLAGSGKLDVYDQANRKKVMRLMMDYANKLLEKR